METNLTLLGLDAGNGGFKIQGESGGIELLSQIATNSTERVISTLGLRRQKPPMHITNTAGSFYVGAGAHDFGRPVENLDVDRLNGSPEILTLLHASLTRFQQTHGNFQKPLSILVGYPTDLLTAITGEQAKETAKGWWKGIGGARGGEEGRDQWKMREAECE